MSGNRRPPHSCPRCGVHEPRQGRATNGLCDGCLWSPQNPRYRWTHDTREAVRAILDPNPDHAVTGRRVVRKGIVRWVA